MASHGRKRVYACLVYSIFLFVRAVGEVGVFGGDVVSIFRVGVFSCV